MNLKTSHVVCGHLIAATCCLMILGGIPAAAQEPPVPAAAAAPTPPPSPVGPPAAGAPAAPAKPAAAAKPVVIPYAEQSYRVSISLGADSDLGFSGRETQRIIDHVQSLVQSRIGVWWRCTTTRGPAGEPQNRAMLAAWDAPMWNTALEPTPLEKKFALTLDRNGTEFRLSGVEWDRASQSVSTISDRQTFDRRLLPALAADLVFDLFRPLVSIDSVTPGSVEMRIRGGEFLPPDVELMPFAPGDYVFPFLRHFGKNRELKRLQVIPWTQVRLDVVDRGYARGTVISAFGSPLAGNRRRTEFLGMKIRPAHAQTRLQVIPRGKPQSPMAGYRVEILNRPETKDDKVEDRVIVRTDRNGEIFLPADPAQPLRYLTVYSGAAPLAKVPLIPGHVERLVLDAPDDAPRLNVEAETELLQSELVDLVARREVLMARARGASKKANWEQVDTLSKQVDALPTLEQFLLRIEALRNPAIQTAKRSKDKGQESRIVRMCKQITDMANLHLDPVKVKDFHVEMDDLKKAAQ